MSAAQPAEHPPVLASSSVYRKLLLERVLTGFDIHTPAVDETPQLGESAAELVSRLALAKAAATAREYPDRLVIGADQSVGMDGELLSKPGTPERAIAQLLSMSGQQLVFETAVCVLCLDSGFRQLQVVPTRVRFRNLDQAAAERYVTAENPIDCVGGFKAEGLGIALFDAIESTDPTALIGLPLIATCHLLRNAGLQIP